jgi:hypothetical protein
VTPQFVVAKFYFFQSEKKSKDINEIVKERMREVIRNFCPEHLDTWKLTIEPAPRDVVVLSIQRPCF